MSLCWYKQLTEAHMQTHKTFFNTSLDSYSIGTVHKDLLSVVQVKSSNPSSDNLAFVISQHLKKVILVTFYHKTFSLVKQAAHRDMFNMASVSVCTSTAVVSSEPVTYSIKWFSYKDSRKHRSGP
jgi:hypothetical protein